MKRSHIVLLVFIAASIAVIISFLGSLAPVETIASAKLKAGKTVTINARIDASIPMEYDPLRNPNYISFHICDTLGNKARVVYHYEKPYDLEKAERITLRGKMNGDVFDITQKDGILLKCPSKYKDDPTVARKNLTQNQN
ncbi:MAG: cytochrome c maturation protein CcmE [Bacteroidota bacterium]|nr:cytochrome c maturation protein CcmE [Bacteroidota bacterium]MDP4214738.1 cytochrome c maturation protein CcmE [Bacteroidota bacterium]MDP4247407.1 cytochrome c maturation protein CcmE [Bacteroidota bacterium]MDP4253293.1 cytochrome c maturation protein CcmE [Bacteroidota bacterium]MDP4257673.1 cytochrome c maturation protein CcmE [Bacteroidota bacterium]